MSSFTRLSRRPVGPEPRRRTPSPIPVLWCVLVAVATSFLPWNTLPAWGVPPGTRIVNEAIAIYQDGDDSVRVPSNPVTVTTMLPRTRSAVDLLRFAPGHPDAETVPVRPTFYRSSLELENPLYIPLPPPRAVGARNLIDLGEPVPLLRARVFHRNEPLFVRVTDPDQNIDAETVQTVVVRVSVELPRDSRFFSLAVDEGDTEVLRLAETGPDTGVFTGYLQSTAGDVARLDGELGVDPELLVVADYTDVLDAGDRSLAEAQVDPYSVVFSSSTGALLDGATVTLVDATTGLEATVFGDDGVSAFPASVITGQGAVDASGHSHPFPGGAYRFPFVPPGEYRLEVTPPRGFEGPSQVTDSALQQLPGAPYVLDASGSRGRPFTVDYGPIVRVDIPLDAITPELFLSLTTPSTATAVGEFLRYRLELRNAGSTPARDVVIENALPRGFRYESGTSVSGFEPADDPEVAEDGRTLRFAVGDLDPGAVVDYSYVVQVGATTDYEAVNRALARGEEDARSNRATAVVRLEESLFHRKAFLVGRVSVGDCDSLRAEGLEGIRVFLEDGTYAVTDSEGRYHLEGVRPGGHVVQIDEESIPEGYSVASCRSDTRFSKRGASQFVDVQGGTVWRADFALSMDPPARGRAAVDLRGVLEGNRAAYELTLSGDAVPVRNRSLTVQLPEGAVYLENSATTPEPPRVMSNVLVFRLGDPEGVWSESLRFAATIPDSVCADTLETRAVLVLDTPTQRYQRSPLVRGVFVDGIDAVRDSASMVTVGLRAGEVWEREGAAPSGAPGFELTRELVEAQEPGFAMLWPNPERIPAIPAIKLAIKHDPAEMTGVYVNGDQVNPLHFDTMVSNAAATVAVSVWRGVRLAEGDNRVEIVTRDANGREARRLYHNIHYSSAPVDAELVPERSILVADGRTSPVIAVRLTDKDGYPARPGVLGNFTVDAPYVAQQTVDELQSRPVSAATSQGLRYSVGEDGIATIRLQATTRSGEAVIRIPFLYSEREIRAWLEPAARDWILVGFAEGTLGYNTLSGHMQNLSEPEDSYDDGRVAFYAKGQVKGEWLLTLAFDSANPTPEEREQIRSQIDPDRYYPLYGDRTQQQYDAETTEKLYLKLERGQFFALFGDFSTGLTITELTRYNRALTGFHSEAAGKNYQAKVFVSDTDHAFRRDEIRGDGTSGVYRLTRGDVVRNTETVVIQTRDRFRSEIILNERRLVRHLDYDIDDREGTLVFREPIPSKDAELNPVFIVVEYESFDAANDNLHFGGRAAYRTADDDLEVGGTFVREDQGTHKGSLGGADVRLQLDRDTEVWAEWARSRVENDGKTFEAGAYLAEVRHDSPRWAGRAYFRKQESGFGLGQQNRSEAATRKFGFDGEHRFSHRLRLRGTAYRQSNLDSDADRDVGEAQLEYGADRFTLRGGYRLAEDQIPGAGVERSRQATGAAAYWLIPGKLEFQAGHEQSLDDNENRDFPSRTNLGLGYQATRNLRVFAEHEFTAGEDRDTQGSRAGLEASPWRGGRAVSSLERNITENGERVVATAGVQQAWQIGEFWRVDAGLDHSRTTGGGAGSKDDAGPYTFGSSEDFTSVYTGAGIQQETWSVSSRLELRFADTEDRWVASAGAYVEPGRGVGLSGSARVSHADAGDDGNVTDADLRLGLARRFLAGHTVFDRLEFRFTEASTPLATETAWRMVNNLGTHFRPDTRTRLSLQYGAKFVEYALDESTVSGFTDLWGLEFRLDITDWLDLGLHGQSLHAWRPGQWHYRAGASVGLSILDETWLSLGYNVAGFEDEDFSRGSATAHGPFLKIRMRVDQETAADVARRLGGGR